MNSKSTPIGESDVFQSCMAEDSNIRLTNFKALWNKHGWSPTILIAGCGSSQSQWSDLYHGRKSFGEKLARKIEDGMNLVRLSLDDPEGARFEPLSIELRTKLAAMTADEVWKVENMIRGSLGMAYLPHPADDAEPKKTKRRPA